MSGNLIEQARKFAIAAHGDQKYGEDPYVKHLDDVAAIVKRYEFLLTSSDAHTANMLAYLHDVLEDSADTRYEDIERHFSINDIPMICWRLTNETSYSSKVMNLAATYSKIRESRLAVFVKLCDRIANVESCIKQNNSLIKKYQKQHNGFIIGLWVPSYGLKPMWEYLNRIIQNGN